MKKVTILGIALIFMLGTVLMADMGAAQAKTIQLKFAHFMSPKHIQHRTSFAPFAKDVEEITGGKVKIKIYPGGALGKPKQLPDAVKSGITDIAFIIPAYTTGRFPYLSVMDLPFLNNSAYQTTQVLYSLYDQYFSKDFKDYKLLWVFSCGPGVFHSVTKPMNTLEDIKGMKMRAPSAMMVKAFKMMGANPVGMPISKLTMSLQKKVIDGMLTPYSAVADFRLYDLIKYITEIEMYTMPFAVVMNKQKWNSLPDFAKKAIEEAGGKEEGFQAATNYDKHDANTLQEIYKRKKIQVFKPKWFEKRRFQMKLQPLADNWVKAMSKKGMPAKALLDDVKKMAEKYKQ
ncbi:TRAP transporter substrate-binding protein [Thermodesulfobacteriota bacterium]